MCEAVREEHEKSVVANLECCTHTSHSVNRQHGRDMWTLNSERTTTFSIDCNYCMSNDHHYHHHAAVAIVDGE